MLCTSCNESKAIKHKIYGYVECNSCQSRGTTPRRDPEFTTDDVRNQRSEWGRDVLQPRVGGVLSKEYLEEYGTSGIVTSPEEVKKAQYTNKHQKNWWRRKRSKGGRNFKK